MSATFQELSTMRARLEYSIESFVNDPEVQGRIDPNEFLSNVAKLRQEAILQEILDILVGQEGSEDRTQLQVAVINRMEMITAAMMADIRQRIAEAVIAEAIEAQAVAEAQAEAQRKAILLGGQGPLPGSAMPNLRS